MIKCRVCSLDKIEDQFFRAAKKEYYDKICRECKAARMRTRKRKNKETLVDLKGGKCTRCGYSKSLRALQFHHLDPTKKDPYFVNNRGGLSIVHIEKAIKELKGCILVCANCHAEIHEEIDQC